ADAPIHVWGQADYQWRKADGDNEAGRAKSERFSGLIGIDTTVSTAAILGAEVGYVSNSVHDDQFGDKAKADGWQVGLYGAYDPGPFYVKALGTYSAYNGKADRHINFAPLATGATFAGSPHSSPDVDMWTFGLHGGARFPMSGTSV